MCTRCEGLERKSSVCSSMPTEDAKACKFWKARACALDSSSFFGCCCVAVEYAGEEKASVAVLGENPFKSGG